VVIAAWRTLYGYAYADTAQSGALLDLKHRIAQAHGEQFGAWALDQMGTDVMIANRIAMGPGLGPPRFRWVPFDDALLLPLNTTAEAARTPDVHSLYPRESALLRRYLADLRLPSLPPTLDAYLARVVAPTLDRQRRAGAVAIKFELAYLRPLDIGVTPPAVARAIYTRYVRGGTPSHAEYTRLEDFLFRAIAREAGTQGLAVHIHCIDLAGGFYDVRGSDPLQLESVFNDSTLRVTNFVLLHGGWPNVEHTLSMLSKPNVYADISLLDQILPATTLARVLRLWLDEYPEKVLFGTDAFAGSNDDPIGWPEGGYVAATTARQALGLALTAMMRDGDITRDRAAVIARVVLRGNAAALYGLGSAR
jgi:predicted TIM-barrel fold metal-dependent hydrolase